MADSWKEHGFSRREEDAWKRNGVVDPGEAQEWVVESTLAGVSA
jgi:hypothetical protein